MTLTTMKIEYVANSTTTQEAIWLRWFLRDLKVVSHASDPVTLHCDSMAAVISYVKNARYYAKTKYIDVKFKFTRN